jgi:hypothetical protein
MSEISDELNLAALHHEVQKMDAYMNLQAADLSRQRRQLFEDVKRVQTLRLLCSLRSTFLPSSIFNVEAIARLPFVAAESLSVADRIIEIPSISAIRGPVVRFIQAIFKVGPNLADLFATIPTSVFAESIALPFLPPGIKPREFFACSALPSLFGHCWCPELQASYIAFMVRISRLVPNLDWATFSGHWISDCLKSYAACSDLGGFLRASLSGPIFEIAVIGADVMRGGGDHFAQYVPYMKTMAVNFAAHLAMIPKDIRLLVKLFAAATDDEAERIRRAGTLFLECVISPALLNPKAWGIIPATYQLPETPHFSIMVGLWSLVIHPTTTSPLGPSLPDLRLLNFDKFLRELIDVDSNLPGPSVVSWMSVTNVCNSKLLFSRPRHLPARVLHNLRPVAQQFAHHVLQEPAQLHERVGLQVLPLRVLGLGPLCLPGARAVGPRL